MKKALISFALTLCSTMALAQSDPSAPAAPFVPFSSGFNGPNGLITNEFAYWRPAEPGAKFSNDWEVTSGSLFANGGHGWTGVPDAKQPNATSSTGNNSCIFRMTTKRMDFTDVEVRFKLLNQGLKPSPTTPAQSYDGTHIFLRHVSETHLYYASINRRDNVVIIKKKVPGGPSNGGTYYNLSEPLPYNVPYNKWQNVKARVKTNANSTVTIELFANDVLLVSATDNGTLGGAPITQSGSVGIRGDNANLKFENFTVTSLALNAPTVDGAPQIDGVAATDATSSDAVIRWTTNELADTQVEFGPTIEYGNVTPLSSEMVTSHTSSLTGLAPNTLYHYRVKSKDAAGNLAVSVDYTFNTGPATSSNNTSSAPQRFLSPALADGINDHAVFAANTREVSIVDLRGEKVFHAARTDSGPLIVWNCQDETGQMVASGVYIAEVVTANSERTYQSFVVVK